MMGVLYRQSTGKKIKSPEFDNHSKINILIHLIYMYKICIQKHDKLIAINNNENYKK